MSTLFTVDDGLAGESAEAAEAETLVAIAYRRRMHSTVRRIGIALLLITAASSVLRHSWIDIAAGCGAWLLVLLALSYQAGARIERLTGLSVRAQARLWERYRIDPAYAASVHRALRYGGLVRALSELTRPFDAAIDVDDNLDEYTAKDLSKRMAKE